tara:strand:+ start:1107 stop:1730 length:624 start_codon:yes stop_codon:yes gene_type:complete
MNCVPSLGELALLRLQQPVGMPSGPQKSPRQPVDEGEFKLLAIALRVQAMGRTYSPWFWNRWSVRSTTRASGASASRKDSHYVVDGSTTFRSTNDAVKWVMEQEPPIALVIDGDDAQRTFLDGWRDYDLRMSIAEDPERYNLGVKYATYSSEELYLFIRQQMLPAADSDEQMQSIRESEEETEYDRERKALGFYLIAYPQARSGGAE